MTNVSCMLQSPGGLAGSLVASEKGAQGSLPSTAKKARWAFSVQPQLGWGQKHGEQKATAGWLASLPVFEPHWQVFLPMLDSPVQISDLRWQFWRKSFAFLKREDVTWQSAQVHQLLGTEKSESGLILRSQVCCHQDAFSVFLKKLPVSSPSRFQLYLNLSTSVLASGKVAPLAQKTYKWPAKLYFQVNRELCWWRHERSLALWRWWCLSARLRAGLNGMGNDLNLKMPPPTLRRTGEGASPRDGFGSNARPLTVLMDKKLPLLLLVCCSYLYGMHTSVLCMQVTAIYISEGSEVFPGSHCSTNLMNNVLQQMAEGHIEIKIFCSSSSCTIPLRIMIFGILKT